LHSLIVATDSSEQQYGTLCSGAGRGPAQPELCDYVSSSMDAIEALFDQN
jgi:hypothetical protein